MQNHVRSKVMWIPLVLVGSVLYWSLALGLGRMSLSFLSDSNDEDLASCPGSRSISTVTVGASTVSLPSTQTKGPFEVHIVNEGKVLSGVGGNHSQDDGTGRLPAIDSPAPPAEDSIGRTSY